MNFKAKLLIMGCCFAGLTACSSFYEATGLGGHQSYSYDEYQYQPGGDGEHREYGSHSQGQTRNRVNVPNTYHVGENHSPQSHKSRDKNWINSQNPMGYTIELGDDEKPSNVAGALHRTPKNDRKAQVKYDSNGKTHYKGVYGTYNSYQDAKKALKSLPEDVKQKARVKNWGTVQNKINN